VRPQNLSSKISGYLNSSDLNPVTTKSGKKCSSAKRRIRDVSELKKWMTDLYHLLQQTVIDAARISEWRKRLQACVCIRDGLFHHLL